MLDNPAKVIYTQSAAHARSWAGAHALLGGSGARPADLASVGVPAPLGFTVH
jgi:hypothetical protein